MPELYSPQTLTFRSPYGSYCNNTISSLVTLIILQVRRCANKTTYYNMTKNKISNLVIVTYYIIIQIYMIVNNFLKKIPIHPPPKGRGFLLCIKIKFAVLTQFYIFLSYIF